MRAQPHHINRITEFLRRDVVALGWPGLGSLAGMDLDEIKHVLRKVYKIRDKRELGTSAGLLNTFVNRVNDGDYVIVPSPEDGAVYVGTFRGGYRHATAKEQDTYSHQRRVTWLLGKSRIPRDQLPEIVVSSLRAQQPIFSINSTAVRDFIGLQPSSGNADPIIFEIDDISAVEGSVNTVFAKRARRVQKLRAEKIRQALASGGGRLICEVQGCGFDFEAFYGDVGKGFAHVHHRRQLNSAEDERRTLLSELAIICANCHAMIHRHGKCREMEGLISPGKVS
ncbi:MAG TPA: hypothetical protein VIM11_05765 [Tepidisphaeraceae bacterium]